MDEVKWGKMWKKKQFYSIAIALLNLPLSGPVIQWEWNRDEAGYKQHVRLTMNIQYERIMYV